ncbi:hypothetical protein AB7813_12385 [Tardiphaga sp. 20_F10_N6_6]|uniref:hypothetical protein n=1 Tax=unclassified Tardiphaga TaxID=2631404 RepID=UPI003F2352BE
MDQTQDAFDLVAMAIEIVEPVIRRACVARAAPAPLFSTNGSTKRSFLNTRQIEPGFNWKFPVTSLIPAVSDLFLSRGCAILRVEPFLACR